MEAISNYVLGSVGVTLVMLIAFIPVFAIALWVRKTDPKSPHDDSDQ